MSDCGHPNGKEGAEYLVELGKKLANIPVEKLEYDGRHYTRQDIKPVAEPKLTAIQISTLSSLTDLCSAKFALNASGGQGGFEGFNPAGHVVHVVDHTQVQVVSSESDAWANRETLIDCNLTQTTAFTLGKFMGQDEFLIALLSCFVQGEDRDYVAKLAGNALAEVVTTAQDDGVSQQMATRQGATLAAKQTVRNIVKLRLYRTFREVEQPESDFLFRLKQASDNVIPMFAFFEADGGAWKLQAIENVARYLRSRLPEGTTVVS